jgi:uncharacterized protein (TIGR02246 family)
MALLALLLGYSTPLLAQTDDINTLKQLNEAWIHAYPGKDTATMSRIFADDLVLTNPAGAKITKQMILRNVVSGGQQVLTAKVDSVDVRLLGNAVGLVTATASFTFSSDGKKVAGRTCYLDVYEKRNGRWVAVAAHVTSLQ